jgi:O-glycosyl hydrolase
MKTYQFKHTTLLFYFMLLLTSCSCDDIGSDSLEVDGGTGDEFLELTLKPSTTYQTIHGFGASDAWSTQYVGENWPLEKRNQIADWLFSNEFDEDGNPLGIGLDIWRFNLGAGSISQGNNSNIDDPWRRADCFLNSNGYDWTAHEGQRWFVDAAKTRGVNKFIAFSNSPPVTMTSNGLANTNSPGASTANLDSANFEDYADFLATVLDNYKTQYGVEFDYISPFNEPQYDWPNGQEGSPWQNSEIATITTLLDTKLQEKNLNTKIQIAESAKLDYLYQTGDKPGRANQLQDFFSPGSENYIGDLTSLSNTIAGHSYFTTFDTSFLINVRSRLNDEINGINPDMEYWMSEYCLIENNVEIDGNGRDLGIDPALYTARLIHTDLSVGNASSWQWWLAVSPYDYKDGLVYIDNNFNDGQIYDSKLLWGLGNYARFIKPGASRIGLQRSDNKTISQSIEGLLASAYINQNGQLVCVVVNQRNISIPLKLGAEGQDATSIKVYQTSALSNDNLAYKGNISSEDIFEVPARSIVTFIIE